MAARVSSIIDEVFLKKTRQIKESRSIMSIISPSNYDYITITIYVLSTTAEPPLSKQKKSSKRHASFLYL